MPIYEYQCKECGVRFERMQHFSDSPVSVCPECGGQVQRLIQPAGVIFKGSGFYVTDNRSSSRKNLTDTTHSTASDDTSPTSKPKKGSDSKSGGSDD